MWKLTTWNFILLAFMLVMIAIVGPASAESIDGDPSVGLQSVSYQPQTRTQRAAESRDPCARYDHMIEREARQYARSGVLALLAKAAMRRESACNPNAHSRAHARGLMQVMYKTARGMGYRGGSRGLYNVGTSIKYGVKYFDQALRACRYNIRCAAAYYNGGPRTLRGRWYRETQHYVVYVQRNMRNLQRGRSLSI